MAKTIIFRLIASAIFLGAFASCQNPFAPKLSEYEAKTPELGDQRTVEGLFQNFSYSYRMKDTVVYGKLLAENFVFVYRDYDEEPAVDKAWGREVDMITTNGLFRATQKLDLVWNEINSMVGDSLKKSLSRAFILEVEFSPIDKIRLQGKGIFIIQRKSTDDDWKIVNWRDETNN